MSLSFDFDRSKRDAGSDEDLDVESANMAALGSLKTSVGDDGEEDDDGLDEEKVVKKEVPPEVAEAELEAEEADELKALDRLAKAAQEEIPSLEDFGMTDEEM